MNVTRKDLAEAADEQIISHNQADALFEFLQQRSQDVPRFTFTHVLYYLGGLIAIGAMTLLMGLGWESFGGAGVTWISVLYMLVGLKLSQAFATRNLAIPAGIAATFVVSLTPLLVYGLQQWWGLWPDDSEYRDYHRYIRWHWLYMELATLAVGAAVLWRYKYPFLVMPIAVTLWYLTMDVGLMIVGEEDYSWKLRALFSMYLGLLMVFLAFWIDVRARHSADYAFWVYIFGVLAFWCGLSMQHSTSEWSRFLYFCINLLMVGIGVTLLRRVFVVFGALGMCGYLGHLAHDVFEDSWLFPIALTAIGLGIIYLGVVWQKHEKTVSSRLRQHLPKPLRELLENRS